MRSPKEEGYRTFDLMPGQVSIEEILKARDFVKDIGSLGKALAALVILGQLKQEPKPEPEPEQEYYGGA